MKKLFRRLLAFVLILFLGVGLIGSIPAENVLAATTKVTGKFYQSDARKMLKKINKFRRGSEAWYYEPDGSKTKVPGLKKLTYDYYLEKAAMQRAAEIVVSFSHTRPNGTSCFDLYFDKSWMRACGENLEYGTSSIMSMKDALEGWKETNEDYYGQGHRRNMLDETFTSIGIACFEVDGCKYWVQEFGTPNSGKKKTKAIDKTRTVTVET